MRPLSRRPCNAVNVARGTEAACSNVTLSGFVTKVDSGAHTYSAKAPWQWIQTCAPESCGSLIHEPNTSSPGLNCVTFLPTASTWPATSTPSRVIFGLVSPDIARTTYGLPLIKCQSRGLTEVARILIRTSSSLGEGFSMSLISTTSVLHIWYRRRLSSAYLCGAGVLYRSIHR